MNKKGVSEVITEILLILLVIALIIILWNVIIHMLRDRAKGMSNVTPAEINVVEGKTNFLTEPVKITLTRGADELDYASIKIIFYNASSSYTYNITKKGDLPKQLETKTYYIYLVYNSATDHTIVNRLVKATHFTVYVTYIPPGSTEESIAPGPVNYDVTGHSCKTLSDRIFASVNNEDNGVYVCGIFDSKGNLRDSAHNDFYDPAADINNDKNIDVKDLEAFNQNNGGEGWCEAQLSKTENPCSGACASIYKMWFAAYGGDCSSLDYNVALDFNKNGIADQGDYVIWYNNEGSEQCKDDINCPWCWGVLYNTTKLTPSVSYLINKVFPTVNAKISKATNPNVNFVCSVNPCLPQNIESPIEPIENMTLYINDVENYVQTGSSQKLEKQLALPIGSYTWTCEARDSNNVLFKSLPYPFEVTG